MQSASKNLSSGKVFPLSVQIYYSLSYPIHQTNKLELGLEEYLGEMAECFPLAPKLYLSLTLIVVWQEISCDPSFFFNFF